MARETRLKTCNLCEAGCGLRVDVEDGRVARIRGDEDDPQSRGFLCPKAFALAEVQEDPDRLRRPVRRTPEGWQEISWEEALEEVAGRLADIQLRDGDDAVGMYLGNPGAHNFGTVAYVTFVRRALATRNQYTASSCDQNPKHAASLYLFGNVFKIAIPDVDHTDFFLVLGANPVVSNGSLMTAPDPRRRIRALKERGGRLVVVDPRRTETAALADEHLFIRPGADALLLAALVHVVIEEGLGRESHLDPLTRGRDALAAAVARFSPEAVTAATGIPAERIRTLARGFAGAERAVCYGRVGTSLTGFATLASWLVDVLNLLTGNLDRPGGALHATPAVDLASLTELVPDDGARQGWRTRVRGAPAFNGEQPAACLAEEIRTPGPGRVRGMLTVAGNPVLSTPNGREVDRAFEDLEFHAAVDIYCNETTRHADVILPPTWSLEHDNYEIVFHQFAVHNFARYTPPVLSPPPGALREWEILFELGTRIAEKKAKGRLAKLGFRSLRRLRGFLHTRRMLDWMLRVGPHGDGFLPWRRGLRVADLLASPRGVDLGPLRPSLVAWLEAHQAGIDLAHPVPLAELERLAAGSPVEDDGLLLIGRRDLRTNNSWLHNAPLAVAGRDRCTLLMHPDDALARDLVDAGTVRIRSRVGEVVARLEVSDEMMPGVVPAARLGPCQPLGSAHARRRGERPREPERPHRRAGDRAGGRQRRPERRARASGGGGALRQRSVELPGRGIEMALVDWGGDGPLALLHHANGFCAATWALLAEALRPHFRVLALDARGHGDTTAPPPEGGSYAWIEFVDDLVALADVLSGETGAPVAYGIGNSFGGLVTAYAATQRPDLFQRVAMLDPVILPGEALMAEMLDALPGPRPQPGRNPRAESARRRQRVWPSRELALEKWSGKEMFRDWDPRALRLYVDHGMRDRPDGQVELKCDPLVEAAVFDATGALDFLEVAPRLRAPALLLRAGRGQFPMVVFREVAARIPDACLLELDADHLMPMHNPPELAEALLAFAGFR